MLVFDRGSHLDGMSGSSELRNFNAGYDMEKNAFKNPYISSGMYV